MYCAFFLATLKTDLKAPYLHQNGRQKRSKDQHGSTINDHHPGHHHRHHHRRRHHHNHKHKDCNV